MGGPSGCGLKHSQRCGCDGIPSQAQTIKTASSWNVESPAPPLWGCSLPDSNVHGYPGPVKFDKKTPLDDPSVVNGRYAREQPSGGVDKQKFEMWSGLALSVGRELDEWVDEMVGEFWQLEDVCSTAAASGQCHSLVSCEETHWSTLSSDPKSELGPVQPNGRLR